MNFWDKKANSLASKKAKHHAHTKDIHNPEFLAFYQEKSWWFEAFDTLQITKTYQTFPFSQQFLQTFPTLAQLIQQANICEITCDEQNFRLFSWHCQDNVTRGWLNKIETLDYQQGICQDFIAEHNLLLNEIGGIQECSENPNNSFSNNQNFMFVGSECRQAMFYNLNEYLDDCRIENISPIDFENWICFVEEANGGEIIYNPKTTEVLMVTGDHCFNYVTPLVGQPSDDYIYHIDGVTTFVDFVEQFALQWLSIITKKI